MNTIEVTTALGTITLSVWHDGVRVDGMLIVNRIEYRVDALFTPHWEQWGWQNGRITRIDHKEPTHNASSKIWALVRETLAANRAQIDAMWESARQAYFTSQLESIDRKLARLQEARDTVEKIQKSAVTYNVYWRHGLAGHRSTIYKGTDFASAIKAVQGEQAKNGVTHQVSMENLDRLTMVIVSKSLTCGHIGNQTLTFSCETGIDETERIGRAY